MQGSLIYKFPGPNTEPTQLAFYHPEPGTSNDDGFSQSGDKSLITATKMPYTNRVTEIKTIHSFSEQEMLAILVPEPLVDMVKSIFDNITIIPVQTTQKTLKCLPTMLSHFHDEKLKDPVVVTAPDFYEALAAFTTNKNLEKFSLHAVRLHTTLDYIARPLVDLEKNRALISEAKGQIIKKHSDGSGWIAVHKKLGQSKDPLIKMIIKKNELPPHIISSIKDDAKPQVALCTKLSNAKKENTSINYVYVDLNSRQLRLLINKGVHIVQHKHYHAINYPSHKKIEVTRIIEQFNSIEQNSATKIQATYKGFWARNIFQDYKIKKINLQKAQEELNQAMTKINALSGI